jgi:hypothetical protein
MGLSSFVQASREMLGLGEIWAMEEILIWHNWQDPQIWYASNFVLFGSIWDVVTYGDDVCR